MCRVHASGDGASGGECHNFTVSPRRASRRLRGVHNHRHSWLCQKFNHVFCLGHVSFVVLCVCHFALDNYAVCKQDEAVPSIQA